MDNLFFKPHELAARDRKERTGYYLKDLGGKLPEGSNNFQIED
jgi:hypothetical protein